MRIKLHPRRRERGFIVQCIIVILTLVVAGIIIYLTIRFCRDHLGTPPPQPPSDNSTPAAVLETPEASAPLPVPVPAVRQTVTTPATATPCDGFTVALALPDGLTGMQCWIQRSTNLVDWADLQEVFPDANGVVPPWCDNDAPWPAAFYRLRALIQ